MSHVPHELTEEFPANQGLIHSLKQKDGHFARLSDEYHQLNRAIHRIESGVEAASDHVIEEMKKQRLHKKDEIAGILARHSTEAG